MFRIRCNTMDQATPSRLGRLIECFLPVDRNYLIASLTLIAILFSVLLVGKQGTHIELFDYWEHAACIQELSLRPFSPGNPLLALEGTTTLRFTPYMLLLGMVKRLTHLSLSAVIALASWVSFFLFAGGVYLWSREFFQDKKLPLYVLVTLLFLWGEPFNYANEYNLRFLSYSLFYPAVFTINLGFWGLYCLLRYVRHASYAGGFFFLLLAAFIFTAHPLTGSFFFLCSFLVVMTEGERRVKHLVTFLGSVVLIYLISLLWPDYPFTKAVVTTATTNWSLGFRMYLYSARNIFKMGPALLGLPVLFLLLMRRKYPFIVWGFLLCSLIYVLTYVINIRLGERYIFFVIFFLHLALALYFSSLELLSPKTIREVLVNPQEKNIHMLFFLIIVGLSISYQLAKLGAEQLGYEISFRPKPVLEKYTNPVDNYRFLTGRIGEGDIVMSDPLTAWLLPALTGAKITALYHDNPLVPDNNQRVEDAIAFFDPATPLHTRRTIARTYRVSHVLLNFDRMTDNEPNRINNYYQNFRISDTLISDLQQMGTITAEHDPFILFQLNDAAA